MRIPRPEPMQAPSALQPDPGPYRDQNAQPRQSSVSALSHGRHASRAVRVEIHAPLMPISTRTSGTTQQTEAPIAAAPAASSAVNDDVGVDSVMRQ